MGKAIAGFDHPTSCRLNSTGDAALTTTEDSSEPPDTRRERAPPWDYAWFVEHRMPAEDFSRLMDDVHAKLGLRDIAALCHAAAHDGLVRQCPADAGAEPLCDRVGPGSVWRPAVG